MNERRGSASASGLVLAAMTIANAMILVDQTAIPLALPAIQGDFAISQRLVQWVLNGSLLPLAGLLVLGGRLGDMFGRRRIFLIGAVLFGSASAIGGLAPVFEILIAARVVQGIGGALMLPTTVAIVSSTFARAERGRALGTMGGAAAVAGALGPTIGGLLTSTISWRAVLLVNLPLLLVTVLLTLRAVPADGRADDSAHVDIKGAAWLCLMLVSFVFGLAETQNSGWSEPAVLVPIALSMVSAVMFAREERHADSPLMEFGLLRRSPNYLGATISQAIGGMVEMGLGLIFPLLLILNLEMDPFVAGLALIPATVPMIVIAPLVGRWYDRAGGRPPLVVGFGFLALSGLLLAAVVGQASYVLLLPGLLAYGIGLAMVLTTNDPVSLDTIPERDQGQASGVSATAEQFGGAVGIAALYAIFHASYLGRLDAEIAASNLPNLTDRTGPELRDALFAAEQTGLRPAKFPAPVREYLQAAGEASEHGYAAVFIAVIVLSFVGMAAAVALVRKPSASRPEA